MQKFNLKNVCKKWQICRRFKYQMEFFQRLFLLFKETG